MGCGSSKSQEAVTAGSPRKPEKTAAQRKVAWSTIQHRLPRSRTADDKARRITLFEQFDKEDHGFITQEESYIGCRDVLKLDEFTIRLRDIVKRAFAKASSMGNKVEGTGDADKVEFLEFRLFLCYIYDYFELTVMFDEMDTTGNMLLDQKEFRAAVPKLAEWGVDIKDPDAVFKHIDNNGSGNITFDEFAEWATNQKLEADKDADDLVAVPANDNTPQESYPAQQAPTAFAASEGDAAPPAAARDVQLAPAAAAKPRQAVQEDRNAAERKVAWERIKARLPREKTPEAKKERIALFKQFDVRKEKALTLEDCQVGSREVLHLEEFTSRVTDIVKRAFARASGMGNQVEDTGDADKVEFLEFRLFLCYIYDYFELTVMFDEMDESGDMMVDREEFKKAVPKIAEWGLVIHNPDGAFNKIDDNGSGKITFDEFATWATLHKLEADGETNTK